jgi:hypothetical protein
MRTQVTTSGVIVPPDLLDGFSEVEIIRHDGFVVIAPAGAADPILRLGEDPLDDPVTDASVELDRYLYDG